MNVVIISDLTCPWAYIGWHRLQRAMTQLQEAYPEAVLRFEWHPYYIQDKSSSLTTKIAATRAAKGKAMTAQYMPYVAKKLANEGLRFRAEGPIGPTQKAHLLIDYIATRQPKKLAQVIYELYDAFFWQCRNIFETEPLLEICKSMGIEDTALRAYLSDDSEQARVDREAEKSGIHHGVPWTIIAQDEFDGVQEVSTLYATLERNYLSTVLQKDT